ncbi:N-acetyltransferase [Ruegeria sp. HKCCD8929]|uniref:GNAT family N-acetyltransferase n=1 Tax=Ruegeria sp. HKCCD8929 TaxID=2683006 RepID=UPI0014897BAB|nr:GNAT family N-acetyltransferase [Ruegeria sp. HKCCD8929]
METVRQIFDDLAGYACRVSGHHDPFDAAQEFLAATPPGRSLSDKHAFAIMAGDNAVGLVDLVDGFPAPGIAYLGLLAVIERRRGEGLAKAALTEVEAFARDTLKARKLRLGVLDINPVSGFWKHMGFLETGERPEGAKILEKKL